MLVREWLNAGNGKVEILGEGGSGPSLYDLEEVANKAFAIGSKFFKEEMGYSPDDDTGIRFVAIPLKIRKVRSKRTGRLFLFFKVFISWEK
jgi:hypothetical protein